MRKSSIIILGYGFGYIVLSFIIAVFGYTLPQNNLFALNISALLFACAEFFNSSFKYIILCLRQSLFSLFAKLAYFFFERVKNYPIKKYSKSRHKFMFNIKTYTYWYNKLIANHFSRTIRHQYCRLHKTSILAISFYLFAPILLVSLLIIPISRLVNITDAQNQALSLFPLGILFINVFFDSELSNLNENFLEKVDLETKKLQASIIEFKDNIIDKN